MYVINALLCWIMLMDKYNRDVLNFVINYTIDISRYRAFLLIYKWYDYDYLNVFEKLIDHFVFTYWKYFRADKNNEKS